MTICSLISLLLNSLEIITFLFELKINSNDIIKSILYQLVSNYNNNNNTNINNIILNKQTNIQKKYFKRKIFVFFS